MPVSNNPDPVPKRASNLDALRGFAILTMVLSGMVPYRTLPAWMYHAQIPPPDRIFNPNLPGLTWVDLVFPFFLFALGAAIPLALRKRLQKGTSLGKIILTILERGFLLGFFAIFLMHIRPHIIWPQIFTEAVIYPWVLGLLGFILLFAIYVRSPKSWDRRVAIGIKLTGWLGAFLFLIFIRYPEGKQFSLYRSDIILIVLTNVYVFGSLLWLTTRQNRLLRLGILGILIALRLAHIPEGWVQVIWNFSPAPWIYKLYYLQYLFIVIPGTLVGDHLWQWIQQSRKTDMESTAWGRKRFIAIAGLMIGFTAVQLVCLQGRFLWQNVLLTALMLTTGWWLFSKPVTEMEKWLRTLFQWGAYWLILGLIFEPYEGGIKKDHPTISYYFLTTGLAVFLLIFFTVIIDIFQKPGALRLLVLNGQNPMIAYVGMNNLLLPVLTLVSIDRWVQTLLSTPWLGFLRALLYTFLLALIVAWFTRKKLFWRT